MTDTREAPYARLPADLLARLLQEAPRVADRVRDLLTPALEQQDSLRAAAVDAGLIQTTEPAQPVSLCAVDGGFAVERTIAVDMVMAVAVGVEGFTIDGSTSPWDENQYSPFHDVLLHSVDNERLARAAMVIQELDILDQAPHDVRVYDGSHLTPIIQLNSGLSSDVDAVNQRTVEFGLASAIPETLKAFANDPQIVAMPKYDSSSTLTQLLARRIGMDIPGDDKYLTSIILDAGEYTTPHRVDKDPWRMLHFSVPRGSYAFHADIAPALDDAISSLQARELMFSYWKPSAESPTYRIEVKPDLATNRAALHRVFASVLHQMAVPFVREPYPQYLADVMAKSVGLGLNALQAAAHLSLTRENPLLASQLIHSYRTEGI